MAYTDSKVIGEVTEVTGDAKIIRADGTEEPIILGTEVFEGDIVETEGAGAVNIGFIDDSEFAVSADARIAIDEFVFDPASESGAQDFSVMKGVFMYTSGLIGRENPDSVEIDTPVGSIGIRGTIIGGEINPDGESQVTVIEGAIVVRNEGGEQLLSTQYDTVKLTSMNDAPSEVRTLDVRDVANDYGSVKDVSSGLFSSFDDQMKDQGPSDNLDESSVEETLEDAIEEEKAAEEGVQVEEIIDPATAEGQNGEKKVELKMMEKSEEMKENLKENLSKEDVREKVAEFKKANDLDDTTNVKLLKQIDDESFIFKVGSIVDENSSIGTVVGRVGPNKPLPFDVQYELTRDAGGLLQIDPSTGVVTLAAVAPDFEASPPNADVGVRITRLDTGESVETSLHVFLRDVNEAADITAHTTAILNEDDAGLSADTVVSDLTFAEADGAGSGFRTQFSTDDARFEVQMNAGQLQLVALAGASFDFEAEGSSINVSITQNDGLNAYTNYDVAISISDLIDETPTDISVDSNNVDENVANATVVATLSTVDTDASDYFTYSIASGNDDGIFNIVGDQILIDDNTNLDHEYDDSHDLEIQVTDSNGHTYNETITISVDDVNEAAMIHFALKDIYSITDMNALLTVGDAGALIGEIKIDDPDGAAFTAGDFTIIGNAGAKPLSDLFEVKDVSGDIYLALKAGHTLVYTGGFYKINDGSSTYTLGNTNNYDFNFTISGDTGVKTLSVGFGNTTTEGITLGDAADNTFAVQNDDFKLIRGGEGTDLLVLNGSAGGLADTFDFRSTVSNLSGNSADLKSIEEIRISDNISDVANTLKMNIADVLDLLKTSNNGQLKFSSVDAFGSADSKVEFFDGAGKESLTDNGFTATGTVNDSGDTFYVFEHAHLGDVLIEDTIIGAAGGGNI